MISPTIVQLLKEQEETFLTPADKLAVLIDSHNIDHAKLMLSQMTYSRVPVVTQDSQFVGTIGLNEISKYQLENDLSDHDLNEDIAKLVKTDIRTVTADYELEDILRKLIDEPFLPVVDDQKMFLGIITRKSILKAVNSLFHNYDMVRKEKK